MAAQSATPLLKVEGLKQYFKVNKNFTVKAVDDVSFEIYPGETYGLVGEMCIRDRVYTCTTKDHEGETYEETIDALGHEFVNGVCTRCGAPEQAAAENASPT